MKIRDEEKNDKMSKEVEESRQKKYSRL
jgi:hypothetical protein